MGLEFEDWLIFYSAIRHNWDCAGRTLARPGKTALAPNIVDDKNVNVGTPMDPQNGLATALPVAAYISKQSGDIPTCFQKG